MVKQQLAIGDKHLTFKVKNVIKLKLLDSWFYEIIDEKSGLTIFFINNNERHRGFNICVKTPVFNNKGIPHILEHCVLAGSEKYPVKDPFFTARQSSPNTYMNASTYPDRTFFQASSQVKKDFDNLLSVYVDAVFHPLLSENTFRREGYRLDYKENKLSHEGVVYNEMKGVMTDPDTIAYKSAQQSVHSENSVYNYISGGIPESITDLTHKELVEYHKKFYHPSNSCISLYGKLNIKKYLDFLYENISNYFKKQPANGNLQIEKDLSKLKPLKKDFQLPLSQSKEDAQLLVLAFLGPEITNLDDSVDWHVLNLLMFENDYSPMKLALDESPIGRDTWHGSGFAHDIQVTAYFGINGASNQDQKALLKLVKDTAKQVIKNGISKDKIEHILRKYEISGKGYITPMATTNIINTAWRFGHEPYRNFMVDENMQKLRKRIYQKDYFTNLLNKLIINNNHYNFVYLNPVESFLEEYDTNVEKELSNRLKTLKSNELEEIKLATSNFQEYSRLEDSKSELAKLPRVSPSDITTDIEHIPQEELTINNIRVLYHPLNTKGMVSFELLLDISDWQDISLMPYFVIYSEMIGRVGAANYNAQQMAERIEKEISQHVGASIHLQKTPDGEVTKLLFGYGGSALERDSAKLFKILEDYINNVRFDDFSIIKLIIKELHNSAESNANYDGTSTAMSALIQNEGKFGALHYALFGPSFVRSIQRIYKESQEDLEGIIKKLKLIHKQLKPYSAVVNLTCTKESKGVLADDFDKFLHALKFDHKKPSNIRDEIKNSGTNEVILANIQVGYAVKSYESVPFTHKDYPQFKVLTYIIKDLYLHKKIREESGAYGAFAQSWSSMKKFMMASYRDPAVVKSLQVFREGAAWLKEGKFSRTQVKNAICTIIGTIDSPMSPFAKGRYQTNNTLLGITDKHLQNYRNAILKLGKKDLIKVANKYFKEESARYAIMMSKETYEKEKQQIENLLGKHKVEKLIV